MSEQRGGFRLAHAVAAANLLLLTTACASVPIVIPSDVNSFDGIGSLLSDDDAPKTGQSAARRPLRVLLIHGMGTPGPNDFDAFILALANRLRLVQVPPAPAEPEPPGCTPQAAPSPSGLVHPPPMFINIDGVPNEAQARLYVYDFASPDDLNRAPILSVSYLYWAPLTESIKCAALAETGAPQRQWFANVAKQFIDDKLGDVALYAGKYRDQFMRPSVQAALCDLIHGTPSQDGRTCQDGDATERTVLISHSLGGYMLMDAIDEELHRNRQNGALNERTAAYKIMENTQFIYMMANQLAFLDMTTLDRYPSPTGPRTLAAAARRGGAAYGGPGELTQEFAADWAAIKLRSAARTPLTGTGEIPGANRQIVAFSDPNDILTWLVRQRNLELPRPEWRKVRLTNVYMPNNEFSIPPVFSDPFGAHTGYFDNRTVLELLVCGMNNGAVGVCLPNGVQ